MIGGLQLANRRTAAFGTARGSWNPDSDDVSAAGSENGCCWLSALAGYSHIGGEDLSRSSDRAPRISRTVRKSSVTQLTHRDSWQRTTGFHRSWAENPDNDAPVSVPDDAVPRSAQRGGLGVLSGLRPVVPVSVSETGYTRSGAGSPEFVVGL